MKMNDGDEQALWEKLERLVLQWRGLDADSAAARMSLNFAMTETLLTLFPQPEALDALGAFWERDLDKYDPEKGSFRDIHGGEKTVYDGRISVTLDGRDAILLEVFPE